MPSHLLLYILYMSQKLLQLSSNQFVADRT